MPDPAGTPDPALKSESGSDLLSAISREMVQAMKKFFGKGPVGAKSYLMDDLLIVAMRGGTTVAEKTMLEAGKEDLVREFRQAFENEMAERLVGTIEQLTDRKVVNYQSQILFDPDIVFEIFVFDRPLDRSAHEQTAQAILDGSDVQVRGEDVDIPDDE